MRSRFISLIVFMATFVSAEAQVVRTWVSATNGNDGNPCTRSSPCRNFAAAISAVDSAGEVVILDSGGYGPVVVDKSVALICPSGIHGAIAPTTGEAIHVTATGATVIIRGLYLNGQGASTGILHQGPGTHLSVESVVASGFMEVGIVATERLTVRSSRLRRSGTGIFVAITDALVTDTLMVENLNGGLVVQDAVVTARNCGATGSTSGDGFLAIKDVGVAQLFVERCFAIRNLNGFRVHGDGDNVITAIGCLASHNQGAGFRSDHVVEARPLYPQLYLSRCTSTQNQIGVRTDSLSAFQTPVNNFIFGNVIDVDGNAFNITED